MTSDSSKGARLRQLAEDYRRTLDYLFRQLPMYQRVGPKAFKKDLTNILALTDYLGNPDHHFPSIHLAGTNGKGSTAHLLAAVLQAHGLKTGLYTSPHYRDFRERIKINGRYIEKRYVVDFVHRHKEAFDKIKPSFFEITVALAFDYFADRKVDVAVIETGLGGRLDSTNIITPLLSIITNIGWDHMNFLGDSLELIAGEKAGIIKPGVPVVVGEALPETRPVFERHSREKQAPITWAEAEYEIEPLRQEASGTTYRVGHQGGIRYPELPVNSWGDYQRYNLATALTSLDVLAEKVGFFELREEALREGLSSLIQLTRFKGRWQILREQPLTIADSAHNEPGLQRAMAQLQTYDFDRLHLVLGAVNDKDLNKLLQHFPPEARYYFCRPDIPRGLAAEELQRLGAGHGLQGRTYSSVRNALRAARRAAAPEDLIYVGGSTFVVAEVV